MSEISDSMSSFNFMQPLTSPETDTAAHVPSSFLLTRLIKTSNNSGKIQKSNCLVTKIKDIACVILNFSISGLFYWLNPSLFAIGFMAGMILNEQTKDSIQKIKEVWKNQRLFGTFIGSLACVLSLPVTLATASILWSAHMGALLSEEAQKQVPMSLA